MKNITWITSYPKSGNTWVRAIIYCAIYGHVQLNKIGSLIPGFSRPLNIVCKDIEEVRPPEDIMKFWESAQQLASKHGGLNGVFLKTHNAYGKYGKQKFPSELYTEKTVYIVRNPRDVIQSYAYHYDKDLISAKQKLMSEDNAITDHRNPKNIEFLSSWGGHVSSWLNASHPILLVRYEDLKFNPIKTVNNILNFLRITPVISLHELIDLTSFERLQLAEKTAGFSESVNGKNFFRKAQTSSSNFIMGLDLTDFDAKFHEILKKLDYA